MFIAVSPKRIALHRSEMLSERHGTPTEREFERIKSYKHVVPNGTKPTEAYCEASDLELWQCTTCHRSDTKSVHKVLE
jgi:hypothetical protein